MPYRAPSCACHTRRTLPVIAAALVAVTLAACGGDGDGTPAVVYRVGGVVSALGSGKTLVLQNNAADDLTVTGNGSFSFPTLLASGTAYAVTVKTQPDGQTCSVTNGTGTASGDVSDVAVACVTGTTPPGNGGGTTGPTQGAAGLAGTWAQDTCVSSNGKGNRNYLQVTQTGASSVTLEQGVFQYPATNCTGSPAPYGPATPAGTVSFSRSAATATLAANWGLWTSVAGQNYAILAKKGETVLCLIGDVNPSALPTAADVEGYANLSIAAGGCFTRQ